MENKVVMDMKNIVFSGNIIDNGWIENLKYENGKTNMNAVMILSEIVYWYRPSEVRDEYTGSVIGYKKKFKADKLQKSYEDLGNRFGITSRQAKLACNFLKDKGIITMEFRNLKIKNMPVNNVLYIEPIIENLKKITGINREFSENSPQTVGNTNTTFESKPTENNEFSENKAQTVETPNVTIECHTPDNRMSHTQHSNVIYPTIECHTNTKNTPKTTPTILLEEEKKENYQMEIYNAYREALGRRKLTASQIRILDEIIKAYSKDLILLAIQEMVEREVINIKYLKKTLVDWSNRNLDTVDKIKQHFYNHEIKKEKVKLNKEKKLEELSKDKPKNEIKSNEKKPLRFANYEQRDYDYDSLEKKLLGWDDNEQKEEEFEPIAR